MHSDPVCLIITSRLRPGLDGGYTVATMRRAQLLAEAGHPVVLATVDLHPDYTPFADEFRRLGLADSQTVMRNLLEEVRSRPAILRDAADPELAPTIDESAGTHREAFELDAAGVPWRQVVRDAIALGFDGIFLMEHYGGDSLGNCATNQRYLRSLLPKGHA